MSEFEAFHEVRFPVAVSFGATGGPARRNEIVLLTSGHERRNARFSDSRRSYDAGTGMRSLEDVHDVVAFFEARRGSLHGFRFRDPFDMKSCRPGETPAATDQPIGTGDGTAAEPSRRPSTRPSHVEAASSRTIAWIPPKTSVSLPGSVRAKTSP